MRTPEFFLTKVNLPLLPPGCRFLIALMAIAAGEACAACSGCGHLKSLPPAATTRAQDTVTVCCTHDLLVHHLHGPSTHQVVHLPDWGLHDPWSSLRLRTHKHSPRTFCRCCSRPKPLTISMTARSTHSLLQKHLLKVVHRLCRASSCVLPGCPCPASALRQSKAFWTRLTSQHTTTAAA